MIGTLIESQAHLQRHSLGSVVSVLAHATLIASAVVATAVNSPGATVARPVEIFHIAPPVPEPTRKDPRPAPAVQTNVPVVPQMPTIRVPTIIPTEFPPVDLAAVPTAVDFSEQRSHSRESCTYPCPRMSASGDSTSPLWAVNEVMMQLREPPVPPRYPEALRRAGIDGTVIVKFVVDTLGRVDPASIEVLNSSHDLFTAAVRETLARLRFNPARAGDRKVRAAATMPFQFTLK